MKRWLLFLVVVFGAVILGCGGGGGGVSSGTVNVVANVLWVETGSATSPQATVRIGDVSTLTDQIDGFVSLDVPPGNLTLTVTFTPTGSPTPIVRTFALGVVTGDIDLGEIYVGPEEIALTGQIVDSTTSNPVNLAQVKFAGRTALTGSDGRFTVTNVAYSSATQSVFFGIQGQATKTGYFTTFFSPTAPPTSGVLDLGTLTLTPEGSTNPPPVPFNVNGLATPTGGFAEIEVLSGITPIRNITADAFGNFTLWLPVGSYTVNATSGIRTGTTNLTVTSVSSVTNVQITLN